MNSCLISDAARMSYQYQHQYQYQYRYPWQCDILVHWCVWIDIISIEIIKTEYLVLSSSIKLNSRSRIVDYTNWLVKEDIKSLHDFKTAVIIELWRLTRRNGAPCMILLSLSMPFLKHSINWLSQMAPFFSKCLSSRKFSQKQIIIYAIYHSAPQQDPRLRWISLE